MEIFSKVVLKTRNFKTNTIGIYFKVLTEKNIKSVKKIIIK